MKTPSKWIGMFDWNFDTFNAKWFEHLTKKTYGNLVHTNTRTALELLPRIYIKNMFNLEAVKKLFLKTSHFLQENSCVGASFCRSSHPRCSIRKGLLINFAKFTEKHLCQSLFLIKLQASTFFTEHLWATASVFKKVY